MTNQYRMKSLMENMRMLGTQYSFERLCENIDRGIMTPNQAVIVWESQILKEANIVLSEGMMDILRQGYQMGKNLAGKAKEAYDNAVSAVSKFFSKLNDQVLMLIAKGQVAISGILSGLGKIRSKIGQACKSHPVLCKASKITLAMLAVSAAMMVFSQSAEAGVDIAAALPDSPKSEALTDEALTALKGFTALFSDTKTDPELKQKLYDAYQWLENAQQTKEIETIKDGPEILKALMKHMYEATENDPTLADYYVRMGEKTVESTKQWSRTLSTGGSTKFTSGTQQALTVRQEIKKIT